MKLLIYIPGYRVVTSEFGQADLLTGKVFIPPLVPLATTPVRGTFVDSSGEPLPDQMLTFQYSLGEAMDYFNYTDGFVPQLMIATVKTDARGEFKVDLPSLPDDPFFSGRRTSGQFQISSSGEIEGLTTDPRYLTPKKDYSPLLIRKTQVRTIRGVDIPSVK